MSESKIEVLSGEVVDQIAAGEVVERPAHLVKELIENSLDAGATEISVEFSEGGRAITVTDNGRGMSVNELPLALERHATSKIRVSDDLWRLKTFGFRGEALASIAAVSKLQISSKTKNETEGARLISQFGQFSASEGVGHTQGTRVQVSELFANVPARLKFLKSASAESSQIKTVIKAMALAHPLVHFRVTQENQLLHLWPAAESHVQRAQQIFEIDELYEGFATRDGVNARAVFAPPSQTTKTSRQIWLYAQNRWVQDRSLQAAVMEAYRNLLMHGEYPIAAVWVEADPSMVDVNIHPSKSQVKFAEPSLAFRAVQASLRDRLEQAPWMPQSTTSRPEKIYSIPENSMAPSIPFQFSDSEVSRVQFKQKLDFSVPPISGPSIPTQVNNHWSRLQILGQANLTYLICQSEIGIVYIDQHAAHERVLFEKLMSAWKGGKIEVQDFLFPLAIDLSAEKTEALLRHSSEIKKLGIDLEALGPSTLGVKAAPAALKESSLANSLEKMAQEISEFGGSHQIEKTIGDLCASMACHSAIRAGQALNLEEMKALLQQMDESPISSFCPHGRPVSVNYDFAQLEKDFGRTL